MPDTIVPIVRRPVRRVSTTPATEPKVSELSSAKRKLSIGGENNERVSPPRLTRSFVPTASPTEERRRTLISDSSRTPSEPEPTKDIYKDVKGSISGFPVAKRDNLPALPVAKTRPIKTSKDLELERRVMQWIINIVKEKPESPSLFDKWIQDGSILSKLMIGIVFNSVPVEQIYANWGCNPVLDRVKSVIHEMRRYGVTDLFEPADLMELRNIPKVTRALAQLCKLASADTSNLLKH